MTVHRFSLKEGKRGRRAFLSVGTERAHGDLLDARFEWYWLGGSRSTGFAVLTDDDTAGWTVSARLHWVASAYLTVGSPALGSWRYRRNKRLGREYRMRPERNVVSVAVHDRAVWWELWHPLHEWHSGTPRWRSGNFNVWDWLVGETTYTVETVHEEDTQVLMPEGVYPAHVKIERAVWSRPRWPAQVVARFHVEMADGGYLPIPGKGENSYDCGPDGTFSMSGPLPAEFVNLRPHVADRTQARRAVQAALDHAVTSTLRTRHRRGVPADYAEPIS